MPEDAAINSAATNDLQLYPSPNCIPVIMDGTACGKIIFKNLSLELKLKTSPTSKSFLS